MDVPKSEERELKKELIELLTGIAQQIQAVKLEARGMGIDPHTMRTHDGSWPLIQLYAARAHAFSAYMALIKKE